ncbi:MAG: iron-containing redox enzyme family protein [Moorea sp. SIO3I7]|nr:iron-containing redox enzyme family protein [Moorena sp. SIO3I7]
MTLTKSLLKQPLFKNQVCLKFSDTRVEIRYQNQGCSITVEPEKQEETYKLFQLLQFGGMSPEELGQECPGIREQIPDLLIELDRRGMLIDREKSVTSGGVTGHQFYRELYRFLNRLKMRFPESPYSVKMVDKTITREQLIGYSLESYHVTHLCPSLLAPSLANYESPKIRKLLREFFGSELHHDRLIEKSLKSVGISGQQLQRMLPLPMTFAVCSSLAVFAKQHPLSFKAALLMFEEHSEEFHQLFKQRCQDLDLPSDFYQPILLHAKINDDGAHEDITEVLLADVAYVSPEDQLVVKKNMTALMESMVLRTHEILDYYGNPQNRIPRCFDTIGG